MMITLAAVIASLCFVNGEFEDASKFGKINDSVEILPRNGLNGSAGLRISPARDAIGYCKPYEYRLETDFVPEPGVKYVLSAVRK